MPKPSVLEWLLEEDQPAVRYFTLVDLLGLRENHRDVRRARSRIPAVGWASEQLRKQGPKGFWERREPKNVKEYVDFLYYPKYLSTNWRALILSDMGLDRSHPQIRKLAEVIFEYKLRLGSPFNFFHEEVCVVGNTARMLTHFGYADDRRVQMLYDWMIEDQRADGGWNCSQGSPGTLDCWEALAALASYPKVRRSRGMQEATAKGAEFYLRRGLIKEGSAYPPWLRLHYPNHYYYDILVGLDVLTELGFAGDRRLKPTLRLLLKKRQQNGTWLMERLHPDVSGPKAAQYAKGVTPLSLEAPGHPSKWLTLKALRVLKRVEDAA